MRDPGFIAEVAQRRQRPADRGGAVGPAIGALEQREPGDQAERGGEPPFLAGWQEAVQHRLAALAALQGRVDVPGHLMQVRELWLQAGEADPVIAGGQPVGRDLARRQRLRVLPGAGQRQVEVEVAEGGGLLVAQFARHPDGLADVRDRVVRVALEGSQPSADPERPRSFPRPPGEDPQRLVEPALALAELAGQLPVGVQPNRQPAPLPPPLDLVGRRPGRPLRRGRRARARARRRCSRAPRAAAGTGRSGRRPGTAGQTRSPWPGSGRSAGRGTARARSKPSAARRRTRAACQAAGTGSLRRPAPAPPPPRPPLARRASPPTCRPGRSGRARPHRRAAPRRRRPPRPPPGQRAPRRQKAAARAPARVACTARGSTRSRCAASGALSRRPAG